MSMGNASIADLVQLVRAEYLEIPGLHLTQCQAQRLWGLDAATCEALLDALVRAGFLRRTRDKGYVRAEPGLP
jgi:DNA-binding IclR family transcriptional regulator